jgi:hypothetical protein
VQLHKNIRLLLLALVILPAARAQQSAPIQSGPAGPIAPFPPETGGQSELSLKTALSSSSQDAPTQPDSGFLSGGEIFGLLHGVTRGVDPSLQFSESRTTGLVGGRALSATGVGGSLNVVERRGRYHLSIAYNGSESINVPSYYGVRYLPSHAAAVSQEIDLRRWTLRLRNDVSYSWGSSFSGLLTGVPAEAGTGALNSLQPSLVSAATIQTGLSRQVSNTGMVEVDYAFSRRSTMILVGTYSITHFVEAGYIDSQNLNGRVGYNYALSAKNSIGVTYGYERISFAAVSGQPHSYSAQLTFGRKVNGRLAFQAAAGPQLLTFANFGASVSRQLSWSAFSAVSYQWHRSVYALSYFRGVTAGSGVYLGSNGQTVTVSLTQAITRSWFASVNGGYATNKPLQPVQGFASYFNDWFASTNLSRQIGPQVRLSAIYGYQQQTGGTGSCPVSSCALPGSFSQLGVSLQWHPLLRGK